MSRIDSLEKKSLTGSTSSSSSASGTEVTLLKQQLETVKQTLVQTRSMTNTTVKDNKDLKNQVDALKNELNETKELLVALQNLTMDNSQKILSFSLLNDSIEGEAFVDYNDDLEVNEIQEDDNDNDEQNEIVGTNLKELIENEMNAATSDV
jgi:hypothetical protein